MQKILTQLTQIKTNIKYELAYRLLKDIVKFVSPIAYVLTWLFFLNLAYHWLPTKVTDSEAFLIIYTTVFIFVLITKSTSWTIGNEYFGIKGDSKSRIVNYHGSDNGDYWFDLFADNPELLRDDRVKKLIESLIKKEENT